MDKIELRKFVAPEFIVGTDVRLLAGQYLKNYGARKAMVVSDQGVKSTGLLDQIFTNLELLGINYVENLNVSPNPVVEEVMEGAEIFLTEGCDSLLAIGGGSAMDCAKGIGIVAYNGGSILDYVGVDRICVPPGPKICIPTTSGTSSDVSQFAIIRDQKEGSKVAIISKFLVPDVSLIDPHMMITMDPYLTACTGMDALSHAIEAFLSNGSSLITDNHALNAVRIILENIHSAVISPDDINVRYQMAIGSLEAGLAFSNASLGLIHAMSHSLGGMYNLPHGECNALLMNYVLSFNFPASENRVKRLAEIFGIHTSGLNSSDIITRLFSRIEGLKQDLGIQTSLKKNGVHTSDIPLLAGHALIDPCLLTNPRPTKKRDIEVLYEEAM